MKTIECIVEVPLFELQTEKAKNMDITISNCCVICGKKIKDAIKDFYISDEYLSLTR